MIKGVKVKKLKLILDERGKVMEILRDDDDSFKKFGQVYMTTCNPGFVKGWHHHKTQTDNFTCVKGQIRLLLYDNRDDSETKGNSEEFVLGLDNPLLVQIPPGVLHGFESVGDEEAVIINTPTEHYNKGSPDEYRVAPFDNDIPLKWNNKKGW